MKLSIKNFAIAVAVGVAVHLVVRELDQRGVI